MLHIKIKNKTSELTTFEVITRSVMNYKEFDLETEILNELFVCTKNDMINTHISYSKEDIYRCIDESFENKLAFWLYNIKRITPLFVSVYESDSAPSGDRYLVMEEKESYRERMGGDNFTFNKDFIFFRKLFSTAKDASYGRSDFVYGNPEVLMEGVYVTGI